MNHPHDLRLAAAAHDFRRARRQAALQDILARVTGRPADLLSYEEVRKRVHAEAIRPLGVQEVPLDAIVGSVGRYTDFTRSFLPRWASDEERWSRMRVQVGDRGVLAPIQLYKIGDLYFVCDGHHRVSVARQLGATHIPARVTEIVTRAPLSPEDSPDEVILKAEESAFLEQTRLDERRPEAQLEVSVPGQYPALQEEIALHRHRMTQRQENVSFPEAAADWYDHIYKPAVEAIREQGILRDFPGRTETDLYLWVSQHRATLEQELEWSIRPQEAAEHLVEQSSPQPRHILARIGEKIRAALTPYELRPGPPTGHWRAEHVQGRPTAHLFGDILVAIDGEAGGWRALEVALEVARREHGRLHGLHVISPETEGGKEEATAALRAAFQQRCRSAGVEGELAVEAGNVAQVIVRRARWTDLVVISLSYPPPPQPIARLGSGVSNLLRHSPRPVLTVPLQKRPLRRALLAYDGSPKSEEALYVATYLALHWNVPLVVTTVIEGRRTTDHMVERAQRYLESHGVEATYVTQEKEGTVAETLLAVADAREADLVLTGGYGLGPVLEVVLGSAVDQLLRAGRRPLLICR